MFGGFCGRHYARCFIMENIINSFDSLYKAYKKTRKSKMSQAARAYELNAVEKTLQLSQRLQSRDYSFGPYFPFKVYEPKERLVLALDFQSKVVLHSLCDNLLVPVFFKRFITDNYGRTNGQRHAFWARPSCREYEALLFQPQTSGQRKAESRRTSAAGETRVELRRGLGTQRRFCKVLL